MRSALAFLARALGAFAPSPYAEYVGLLEIGAACAHRAIVYRHIERGTRDAVDVHQWLHSLLIRNG